MRRKRGEKGGERRRQKGHGGHSQARPSLLSAQVLLSRRSRLCPPGTQDTHVSPGGGDIFGRALLPPPSLSKPLVSLPGTDMLVGEPVPTVKVG